MKSISLFLLIALSTGLIKAQTPRLFPAVLESATVYRAGAELNHKARINIPTGTSEIVITNVANTLDENSIQISVPPGVTILSTSFSKDYLKQDNNSPAYRIIEDSLTSAKRELVKVQNKSIVEANLLGLLDKNQTVGGTNIGVNVNELIKVADYYKSKQLELRNSIATLQETEQHWQRKIAKLQKQLLELSQDKSGTTGQVIINVLATQPVNADFNLSYLSPNAQWQAFYDLRAENTASPLKILYKASISQYTGIDWKKVKLSLSTGNPTQNGTAPLLSSWFLQFGTPQYQYAKQLSGKTSGIMIRGYNQEDKQELKEVVITSMAKAAPQFKQVENQLNVVFDVDIPYDIASNSKPHSVMLKETTQSASFKYYSIPKMDNDVFLMAEITDYEKLNLLPGEANLIFENSYIGKSYINPNALNDTLKLSMGRDKKIIIKREKIAEQTGVKTIGSNKKQTFTYEITIRNSKKENINLQLKDQYPISTDKDMEVELLSSSGAEVDKETGILTWNLNMKPSSTQKIRISYSVKYPKDKVIPNLY
ncbi:MAG: DUF4139 domain-containing protein [Candidatus Pedobacter colombiensis]|uniref:DUF4139 domain-containing protein n=1 Tax=Candidatus Pedobacter colombiensis TaxID=3121371 RepID=A0AAJ5W6E2_9SPHI|nr:DUF4139 domain-containing protein [Pedobacter sp.]WEK18951.1 MAG: DUF4139 domain-containing protein [Pedobacter sp.]